MTEYAQLDQWLQLTGNGDMDAFERLYHSTGKSIFAYILSIVKHHEVANDVFQDTYIKIKTAAKQYKSQKKPLAWMFTIAKHTAYDVLKKEAKVVYVDYNQCEYLIADCREESWNDHILLTKALEVLDLEQRQIVFLHAVSGFKHKEIAAILDIPLGTVLWKYNRAIKILGNEMKD